jgi:hypothetical protein
MKLPQGYKAVDIQQMFKNDYDRSYDVMFEKHSRLYDRRVLYGNTKSQDEKTYVRYIYQAHQTLMGIAFKAKPRVKYVPEDIGDMYLAENLRRVRDYDVRRTHYKQKMNASYRHKFFD